MAMVLGALKLRNAPVTVVFSIFALLGWTFSLAAMRLLSPLLLGTLTTALIGTGVLVASIPLALALTSLAIRPLRPIFVHDTRRGQHELVGKTCQVMTGSVDDKFGQARLSDKGQYLLLQVRNRSGARFKRNEEVLIVDYDRERDSYLVEPMQALLPDRAVNEAEQRDRPATAAAQAQRLTDKNKV